MFIMLEFVNVIELNSNHTIKYFDHFVDHK